MPIRFNRRDLLFPVIDVLAKTICTKRTADGMNMETAYLFKGRRVNSLSFQRPYLVDRVVRYAPLDEYIFIDNNNIFNATDDDTFVQVALSSAVINGYQIAEQDAREHNYQSELLSFARLLRDSSAHGHSLLWGRHIKQATLKWRCYSLGIRDAGSLVIGVAGLIYIAEVIVLLWDLQQQMNTIRNGTA